MNEDETELLGFICKKYLTWFGTYRQGNSSDTEYKAIKLAEKILDNIE